MINLEHYCTPKSFDDPCLRLLNIKINRKSRISFGNFTIGRYSKINGSFHAKHGTVNIGQFITGGFDIKFIAGNHNINAVNMQVTLQRMIQKGYKQKINCFDVGYINIGNNVWLGDNCTILKNVTIGDGAVIGAGAIVTSDIPPFAVAVGVPATVIKYRFSESIRQQLLEIKWWDWPMDRILAEKNFFTKIFSEEDYNVYSLLEK